MIINIDGADYKITCFRCGSDIENFNSNDDLRCPSCKVTVSQAGIISAYEELLTYVAAESANDSFKGIKGYKPAKIPKPPFMFTAL